MIWELPVSVEVKGQEWKIQSDYRAILDICIALNDAELSQQEKAIVALDIFYPDWEQMLPESWQEALEACFRFIDMGHAPDKRETKPPRLMDWEQDFSRIVAPVNRIAGTEIRLLPYLHWWTFLAYYHEIGDCLFAQIVRIRDKKARGKALDKYEREWYARNRRLVDLQSRYTQDENELLKQWGGG